MNQKTKKRNTFSRIVARSPSFHCSPSRDISAIGENFSSERRKTPKCTCHGRTGHVKCNTYHMMQENVKICFTNSPELSGKVKSQVKVKIGMPSIGFCIGMPSIGFCTMYSSKHTITMSRTNDKKNWDDNLFKTPFTKTKCVEPTSTC